MPGHTFTASREELKGLYREVIEQNPLLGRIEASLKGLRWTDEEIRTYQLLIACQSNASLKAELEKFNAMLKAS